MYKYIYSLIAGFFNRISSLVRNNTGLLVSLCISLAIFCMAGCADEAVVYEATAATDAEGTDVETQTDTVSETATDSAPDTAGVSSDEKMLIVHLCGAVNNPGVYELDLDSRIIDGIDKAGGFTEEASRDTLNLAMELTDGSRIYVPTEEEVRALKQSDDVAVSTSYVTDAVKSESDGALSGTVNINTAKEEALTTLTGIGPNRAKAIIAYREEHGGFKSKEELMNVSGIGKASFDKIKDDITV